MSLVANTAPTEIDPPKLEPRAREKLPPPAWALAVELSVALNRTEPAPVVVTVDWLSRM